MKLRTCFVVLSVLAGGCGEEAPAAPAPPPPPVVEPEASGTPPPEPAAVIEPPATPTPVAASAAPMFPSRADELPEVRRAFEALLRELEPVGPPSPDAATSDDCSMGCAYQDDTRLVLVSASGVEGDGSPTSFDITVAGARPMVRHVRVPEVDTDEARAAWLAYGDGQGPAPWLDALRAAMPTLRTSRPAPDLVTRRATRDFSLSAYAPLVALGGAMEGRFLFWFTSRHAHHLYLVHGPEHQMRWVASLPHTATLCPGTDALLACVQPVGIDAAYAVPGAAQLLLKLYRPEAGHGIDAFSSLVVPLGDDDALEASAERDAIEIEASLAAPGDRVHPVAIDLEEETHCGAGCVYFRRDASYAWAFPEVLVDGDGSARSVRRRDGTIDPLVPASSALRLVEAEVGEGASPGRDLVARSLVAADGVSAFSPLVELGPPHVGRRLSLEGEPGHEALVWIEGERRVEVGRVTSDPAQPTGPFGIDRVLAPEGAGYPLIVVTYARLAPTRAERHVRHRIEVLVIPRPPDAAAD